MKYITTRYYRDATMHTVRPHYDGNNQGSPAFADEGVWSDRDEDEFQIEDTSCEPARLSDFIYFWQDYLKPGDLVGLYCRVSTREQLRKGNLDRQVADMQAKAGLIGVNVAFTVAHQYPAWHPDRLEEAVLKAMRHGVVGLLAHTASRFLRNGAYKLVMTKWKEEVAPTQMDAARLLAIADGVPLITYVHPDATDEGHSAAIIRGQSVSNRKGGRKEKRRVRGEMKRRHAEFLPIVLQMAGEGVSNREIARRMGVDESTVRQWKKGAGF